MAYRFCYITIILLLFAYSNNSKGIKLKVRKDKVLFHNWHPSKIDNQSIGIYVWNTNKNKPNTIPIAGKFRYGKTNVFEFIPEFPLLENTQYILIHNTKREKLKQRFSLPKKEREPLTIETVYPTSDSLPENLLRIYIVFSQPMKTSGSLEKIKLFDETGNDVSHAIFNNVYELWDRDQKRLTILFDPSRIKKGLQANLAMGRVLKPGLKYSLIIKGMEDIYGQIIQVPYKKTFRVIEEDILAPDTNLWEINTLQPNTRAPLIINFPDMLDYGSLLGRIRVLNSEGNYINGEVKITNKEKDWQFIPEDNWGVGNYHIHIDTQLEDPSGNNLNGLFDHKSGTLKANYKGNIMALKLDIR